MPLSRNDLVLALLAPLLACSPPEVEASRDVAPGADPPEECDGIDLVALQRAVDWIESNPNAIDSLQIHHCGELLVERYYHGYTRSTPHELQSATKSYTAVLVGIAIDQGLIRDVSQPIVELLPAYADLLTGEKGEKGESTVEHLLTMTSGLAWTDFGTGNEHKKH